MKEVLRNKPIPPNDLPLGSGENTFPSSAVGLFHEVVLLMTSKNQKKRVCCELRSDKAVSLPSRPAGPALNAGRTCPTAPPRFGGSKRPGKAPQERFLKLTEIPHWRAGVLGTNERSTSIRMSKDGAAFTRFFNFRNPPQRKHDRCPSQGNRMGFRGWFLVLRSSCSRHHHEKIPLKTTAQNEHKMCGTIPWTASCSAKQRGATQAVNAFARMCLGTESPGEKKAKHSPLFKAENQDSKGGGCREVAGLSHTSTAKPAGKDRRR